MNLILIFVSFLIGFLSGIGIAFALKLLHRKTARELADELFRQNEMERKSTIDTVVENLRSIFGSLSLDVLSKSTEEFLKLAKAHLSTEREVSVKELDAKKGLIDQQLVRMTSQLEDVSNLMKALEKDRAERFGELATELKKSHEQTISLIQITNTLRETLANTKARGQWGERMAEDVLRLAGFMENVNYLKQKNIGDAGRRPDFTFLLPRGLKLNMDVKFPLDNYVRYIEAGSESDKIKFRKNFLNDINERIKEISTREYINPEENTLDYVLVFIPNEQIYGFIYEQDGSIFDEGIKNRVVLCSPTTLFAILAIIRQAIENFAIEQTSNEMLSLIGTFKKQWIEFIKKFEVLGKRIGGVQEEYDSLTMTRRRQLEKPLNRIDELRTQRGLPIASEEEIYEE